VAQSYITSLIQDMRRGLREPSFETLQSKVETMGLVKETLGVYGNEVPQSTILAVNLLAFGCVSRCRSLLSCRTNLPKALGSEWDEAKGHLKAMQGMVDGSGGIQAIDFELQRILTWLVETLTHI
jgi:hypothetical protein